MDDFFRFCPRCGADSVTFAQRRMACASCEATLFINSAAAVGALIEVTDGLLLAVRDRDPGAGMLDLPGGFLEWDETPEAGLRREINEELGIAVTDLRLLTTGTNRYPYNGVTYHTCDLFYVCRPVDLAELTARDDVRNTVVRDPHTIADEELAFASAIHALQRYRRQA